MLDLRHLCGWCGAEMIGRRANVLYCSPTCQQAEYKAMERAESLKAKADRPPCQNCGAPIPATARAHAIYCNRACKVAADVAADKAARLASKAGRCCAECGTAMPAAMKSCAIFCGKPCKKRAARRRAADPRARGG
jgi:hypothetical protein